MPKHTLKLLAVSAALFTLSGCQTTQSFMGHSNTTSGAGAPLSSQPVTSSSEFWQGDNATIWARLQQIPLNKLVEMDSADPISGGWVKLAIISKRDSGNTALLTQNLSAWRVQFPTHPGNALFPSDGTLAGLNNTHVPQHIAVMLPLQGPLAQQGKTVRNGFLSAYYSSLARTHVSQTISFYDTAQNNIAGVYQKALADGADFIVGPLSKEEVQALTSQSSFNVPTLALNYTDVWFGSLPSNLYQFGLSPLDETQQIADKAKAAGFSRAVIITTDNDWGQRVAKSLTSRWQANGGHIQDVLYISPKMDLTQAVANLLHTSAKISTKNANTSRPEHRDDIDVVFLLTPPQTARQVVPLLRFYYVNKLPIYATSIVYSGSSSAQDSDLEGVVFCDTPWTLNMYPGSGNRANRLYAVGLDAYTLSGNIPRLTTLPNFPVYGATGAMTLSSNHQIYRRLPGVTMHDGHP